MTMQVDQATESSGAEPPEQDEGRSDPEVWAGWEDAARDTLVGAMRDAKVGYKELSWRLGAMGIHESPDRLNRKVNRKRFSAAFLLACLEAIEPDSPSSDA